MTDVEAVRVLARLARLMERASADGGEGADGGGLSLAHFRVLAAVEGGAVRASHVAKRLALGKPTVSASVDALCRRGLLERGQVADDQRATALAMTADGRRVLADVERAMVARLDAVLAHVDDPDAVVAALAGLGQALDAVATAKLDARLDGSAR